MVDTAVLQSEDCSASLSRWMRALSTEQRWRHCFDWSAHGGGKSRLSRLSPEKAQSGGSTSGAGCWRAVLVSCIYFAIAFRGLLEVRAAR